MGPDGWEKDASREALERAYLWNRRQVEHWGGVCAVLLARLGGHANITAEEVEGAGVAVTTMQPDAQTFLARLRAGPPHQVIWEPRGEDDES